MVADDDLAGQAKYETIDVEIVYALSECQVLMLVQVPIGTTVEQAICHSGIMDQFTEIDLDKNRIGIFGRLVEPKTVLQQRDRVEIYRSLLIDPKEARRLRIKRNSVEKSDTF